MEGHGTSSVAAVAQSAPLVLVVAVVVSISRAGLILVSECIHYSEYVCACVTYIPTMRSMMPVDASSCYSSIEYKSESSTAHSTLHTWRACVTNSVSCEINTRTHLALLHHRVVQGTAIYVFIEEQELTVMSTISLAASTAVLPLYCCVMPCTVLLQCWGFMGSALTSVYGETIAT